MCMCGSLIYVLHALGDRWEKLIGQLLSNDEKASYLFLILLWEQSANLQLFSGACFRKRSLSLLPIFNNTRYI